MIRGWNSDLPESGRHQWLLSQSVRLACAVRLGCITEADHQHGYDVLANRKRGHRVLPAFKRQPSNSARCVSSPAGRDEPKTGNRCVLGPGQPQRIQPGFNSARADFDAAGHVLPLGDDVAAEVEQFHGHG